MKRKKAPFPWKATAALAASLVLTGFYLAAPQAVENFVDRIQIRAMGAADAAENQAPAKKAGAEGIKVNLETAEVAWPAGAIDAAVLYAEQAKASGINMQVVKRPNDGFWSNTWSKVPFTMGYVGGRPTEDWIFTAFYAAKAENNDTHWNNPRFEQLLVEGRRTVDPEKRRGIYAEMQKLLHDDGGLIAPLFANHIVGLGSKVTTPEKLSGNWEMDNWRAVERWSLSA